MIPNNAHEYKFYVYAYLRDNGTPYYIGKGHGKRAYTSHGRWAVVPKNKNKIIFMEENVTEIWALIRERYYIRWFGRKDLGTGILLNLTDGGDGISGYKATDELRERLSIAHKGIFPSEATRARLSAARKGLVRSEITCQRLSEVLMGHSVSEEARAKISAARLGTIVSEETKAKLSLAFTGDRNPNFGKSMSEEQKEKLRIANIGKIASHETREKMKSAQTGVKNHFFGRKHSEETKQKIRDKKNIRDVIINEKRNSA